MDQRHLQNRPQPHLEEITFPISCNLCAQEFGDLQTYCTHVRLTHLPFPAPTIKENRHAQPARQPRRHRQHPKPGDEREPRVHQEGRQPRRRRAKAATTNRQPNQTARRRASGSMTVVAKPKVDGKVEQKSHNKIMLKAILKTHQTMRDLSLTVWVWYTLLIKPSSSEAHSMQKQTRTYAEKVRQEGRGHTREPPFVWAYLGLIKSLQQGVQHGRHETCTRPIDFLGPTPPSFCRTKSATRFDSAGWTKRTKRTSRESH